MAVRHDDLFDLAKERLANERRRYRRAPDTQTIDDRDERSVAELMAGDPAAVHRLLDDEVEAARRRAASKPKPAPTGRLTSRATAAAAAEAMGVRGYSWTDSEGRHYVR